MSHVSFILTNIALDLFVIQLVVYMDFLERHDEGRTALAWQNGLHDAPDHALIGALIIGLLVALPRMRRPGWLLGCVIGAVSHILLDALVHSDLHPFWPLLSGNPFYLDLMAPLSAVLTIGCAVWLLQLFDAAKRRREKQ
jgi:hypothetical protein